TPGSKFVTVGACIANDAHGNNHHRAGTFGRHVRSLELLRSDGTVVRCSPTENADMFSSTIGGLGLTGLNQAGEPEAADGGGEHVRIFGWRAADDCAVRSEQLERAHVASERSRAMVVVAVRVVRDAGADGHELRSGR